jgi:hypothetical protein
MAAMRFVSPMRTIRSADRAPRARLQETFLICYGTRAASVSLPRHSKPGSLAAASNSPETEKN